jgi:hypothetical protein
MSETHRNRALLVLAAGFLASACSDGTTAPTPGGSSKSEAIPSYFYQLRLSGAQKFMRGKRSRNPRARCIAST